MAQGLKERNSTVEARTVACSGIEECKLALLKMSKGVLPENFIEGKACMGGCVQGPGILVRSPRNQADVQKHAKEAGERTIAQALASGHTGVIHPTDSYLSYYPQQVGLVAFYEIIIRLWNLLPIPFAAHYILQCINVGMACAIVYFQYKITYLLSHNNDRAAGCYLFLAMLNAPLLFYTSFVYGEIPSFAFLSGGLYLLLKFFLANYLQLLVLFDLFGIMLELYLLDVVVLLYHL